MLIQCLPYVLAAFLIGCTCGCALALWLHKTGEHDCSDWHIDGEK